MVHKVYGKVIQSTLAFNNFNNYNTAESLHGMKGKERKELVKHTA